MALQLHVTGNNIWVDLKELRKLAKELGTIEATERIIEDNFSDRPGDQPRVGNVVLGEDQIWNRGSSEQHVGRSGLEVPEAEEVPTRKKRRTSSSVRKRDGT